MDDECDLPIRITDQIRTYNLLMSVIEDARKAFQDIVAPEIKSLNTRMDGLEKTVDARLETMSTRISSLEREMNLRLEAVEEKSASRNWRFGPRAG